MQRILILATLAALVAGSALSAGDEIPGAPQRQPIALINATIHTAVGAPISNATLVCDKGVITAVGAAAQIPDGARTIDCKGARVYPGFIAPSTTLGLTEIDAVRSTRDFGEVGSLNPNARAETAYNPDSEIIPTVRSNGVLLVNPLMASNGGYNCMVATQERRRTAEGHRAKRTSGLRSLHSCTWILREGARRGGHITA
jgi:imidazolonepropionase-like amidohydrolase